MSAGGRTGSGAFTTHSVVPIAQQPTKAPEPVVARTVTLWSCPAAAVNATRSQFDDVVPSLPPTVTSKLVPPGPHTPTFTVPARGVTKPISAAAPGARVPEKVPLVGPSSAGGVGSSEPHPAAVRTSEARAANERLRGSDCISAHGSED